MMPVWRQVPCFCHPPTVRPAVGLNVPTGRTWPSPAICENKWDESSDNTDKTRLNAVKIVLFPADLEYFLTFNEICCNRNTVSPS